MTLYWTRLRNVDLKGQLMTDPLCLCFARLWGPTASPPPTRPLPVGMVTQPREVWSSCSAMLAMSPTLPRVSRVMTWPHPQHCNRLEQPALSLQVTSDPCVPDRVHTVESRYLELRYIEFCETWSMASYNYNLALQTFFTSPNYPKCKLICASGDLNLYFRLSHKIRNIEIQLYFCVTCCEQRWHSGITSPSSVCPCSQYGVYVAWRTIDLLSSFR